MSDAAYCIDPSYGWANNTDNEDPCRLASLLCFPSPPGLCVLSPGEKYSPQEILLEGSGSVPCICSSVIYALSSACADCLGRGWYTLNQWESNCTNKLQSSMSFQSPPNGAFTNYSIPSWASSFSSNSSNLTYNKTLAEAIALGSQTPLPQTGVPLPTKLPISSAAPKSKSKIGPLVGGIFGGLVLLVILVTYLVKYRRRPKPHPDTQLELPTFDQRSDGDHVYRDVPVILPVRVSRGTAYVCID
ncbi:hypothetical protein C8J56DRAFT_959163 [Mycena floridula]|nr:hypothetical protein C8J56DRAFT_959163 [Mycena floridula]